MTEGSGSGFISGFLPGSESVFGLEKFMNPDPVCPKRLDPDPVNIRPDPKPCSPAHSLPVSLSLLSYIPFRYLSISKTLAPPASRRETSLPN